MPEIICNTSPLQYLHQIGHLDLLRQLAGRIIVPFAVVDELAVGRMAGLSLPDPSKLDWVLVRRPSGEQAVRLITDLGPGESEVLMHEFRFRLAPHTHRTVLELAGEQASSATPGSSQP